MCLADSAQSACLHSMPPRHRPDLSCRDSDMHISNGGAVVSASSTAISNRQSDPTNLAHPPHPPKTAAPAQTPPITHIIPDHPRTITHSRTPPTAHKPAPQPYAPTNPHAHAHAHARLTAKPFVQAHGDRSLRTQAEPHSFQVRSIAAVAKYFSSSEMSPHITLPSWPSMVFSKEKSRIDQSLTLLS